ncbi:hypothetical protein MIDIC_470048 [Alphaproteobacteria bacterium]
MKNMQKIKVDKILYDEYGRPLLAEIRDGNEKYAVSVSDRTQMAQELLSNYAEKFGIKQFTPLSVNTAGKEYVLGGDTSVIPRLINAGYMSIVLPLISGGGGGGHTVYCVALRDNSQYTIKMVTQTGRLTDDVVAGLNTVATQIGKVITEHTKMQVTGQPVLVPGAFAFDVASCTEIGFPFVEAMADKEHSLQKLTDVLMASQQRGFSVQDMAYARFLGQKGSADSAMIMYDSAREFALAADNTFSSDIFAEHVMAIRLGYEQKPSVNDVIQALMVVPYQEGRAINLVKTHVNAKLLHNNIANLVACTAKETIENVFAIKYFAKDIVGPLVSPIIPQSIANIEAPGFIQSKYLWMGAHFTAGLLLAATIPGNQITSTMKFAGASVSTVLYAGTLINHDRIQAKFENEAANGGDFSINSPYDFLVKCGSEMLITGAMQAGGNLAAMYFIPGLGWAATAFGMLNGAVTGGLQCYSMYKDLSTPQKTSTIDKVIPYLLDITFIVSTSKFSMVNTPYWNIKKAFAILNGVCSIDQLTKLSLKAVPESIKEWVYAPVEYASEIASQAYHYVFDHGHQGNDTSSDL